MKAAEESKQDKGLKGRLKGVRKRKRVRRDFECEAVALKMRLVKVKEEGEHQS